MHFMGVLILKSYNFIKKIQKLKKMNFLIVLKEQIIFIKKQIDNVAKMINSCEKPLIYLGQGCVDSYELLREYAIKSNIPVTSTIHGCGVFDESHDLSLQWWNGNPVNYAIQKQIVLLL